MGDAAGACLEGVVWEEGGVEVGEKVRVDGTAGVVAGEYGVEVDEAVGVGALDAAEVGGVVSVGGVVARGRDSTVLVSTCICN